MKLPGFSPILVRVSHIGAVWRNSGLHLRREVKSSAGNTRWWKVFLALSSFMASIAASHLVGCLRIGCWVTCQTEGWTVPRWKPTIQCSARLQIVRNSLAHSASLGAVSTGRTRTRMPIVDTRSSISIRICIRKSSMGSLVPRKVTLKQSCTRVWHLMT